MSNDEDCDWLKNWNASPTLVDPGVCWPREDQGASLNLPGGRGQRDEQGLQDAADIDDRALLGDEEVEGGQDDEAVQHQSHDHCDGIEAQLLTHGRGVVHFQDLSCHQEHDAKGEVPEQEVGLAKVPEQEVGLANITALISGCFVRPWQYEQYKPDNYGDDLQDSFIQTLAEVHQSTAISTHSAQHYA